MTIYTTRSQKFPIPTSGVGVGVGYVSTCILSYEQGCVVYMY